MDDYRRSHIPAFGNWDYSNDLPITQCFESARQAGLIRYSSEERDLYVVDDFYGDDLKKPVKTVVSRRKAKGEEKRYPTHVKEQRKQGRVCDVTEQPSSGQKPHSYHPPRAPKAVDEDLYKIPPELLHNYPKRKKKLGFFSCLVPACAA